MSKYSSLFLADSFAITLANNPFTLVSVVVLQCLIKNRTSIKEIICTLICEKKNGSCTSNNPKKPPEGSQL